MELQQKLNKITLILKQNVGLQYICRENPEYQRETINQFFRFLEIRPAK